MRIGRKIDIDLTIQSFKRYLRSVLFQEKTDIEFINRSCSLAPYEYDRCADAFYIVSKNEEFELTLTPNEYRAIRYFHYHNPIDARVGRYADATITQELSQKRHRFNDF